MRSIYLGRRNGAVEVRHSSGTDSFFFRRGELYLDRDHEVAVRVSPLLSAAPEDRRPASIPELRQAVEDLARELCRLHAAKAELQDDRSMVVEVVGPLPTVCFVQELAVYGCDEDELAARLGGEDVKLRSTGKTPALEQLPGLDPEMAQVMAALEKPATAAQLMRGEDRMATLRGLVKLWAVGLVEIERQRSNGRPRTQETLTLKLLESFSERIARELEEEPFEHDVEEHRAEIGDLLGKLGGVDYYELLGVDLRAGDDELFVAYKRVARKVHPVHARRLGFEGKDEALQVLFERVTEAYLTLSDPKRKASYNTIAGIHVDVQVDAGQRAQERQTIARQNYRRAATSMDEMDYSQAVELLKEAARLDPKAEYFGRLGQAQWKNPNWRHHAIESYRKAVELDPEDAGVRFGLATVLDQMEETEEAGELYRTVLELMPAHPGAQEALERLDGFRGVAAEARTGGFRSLFAGTRDADEEGADGAAILADDGPSR
ncbi:MAG: DnaJ domain-containing protein [Thermoanaerobaculia bacterium]